MDEFILWTRSATDFGLLGLAFYTITQMGGYTMGIGLFICYLILVYLSEQIIVEFEE